MKTRLNHVALQYSDKSKAKIFFTDILKIPKIRSFSLNNDLSENIFGLKENVDIDVYDNGEVRFEVFYTGKLNKSSFSHFCIEIENKQDFIEICKKNGLNPFIIKKDQKELLFVKDFSNNLYEVKEL